MRENMRFTFLQFLFRLHSLALFVVLLEKLSSCRLLNAV